jgi:hypothetical protein
MLLWQAYENHLEKNIAGLSSNKRILNPAKRLAFLALRRKAQDRLWQALDNCV